MENELPERLVWSRGVDMMKVDREEPAQVAFVDDQDLVEQFAAQCLRSSVRRSRSLVVLQGDW
jgi:hypothetical protein